MADWTHLFCPESVFAIAAWVVRVVRMLVCWAAAWTMSVRGDGWDTRWRPLTPACGLLDQSLGEHNGGVDA